MSSATTEGLEGICLEISCENGGTCELVGESDIDFQCRCSLEWTGDYCEDGELSTCFKKHMFLYNLHTKVFLLYILVEINDDTRNV